MHLIWILSLLYTGPEWFDSKLFLPFAISMDLL